MARIGAKDTAPEMAVRRLLHRAGYRFRTHASFLPGTPDVAFTRRKKVVFIHGCFWHRHPGCRRAAMPATRPTFWANKFERNCDRDRRVQAELRDMGWDALVIWECETKQLYDLQARLTQFLGAVKASSEIKSC